MSVSDYAYQMYSGLYNVKKFEGDLNALKKIEERPIFIKTNIHDQEQKAKRKYLQILKKFEFKENEKFISIEPNRNSLNVDFQLVYSNSVIGKQRNQIDFSDKDLSNVYTSRTFCLFEDINEIKKNK